MFQYFWADNIQERSGFRPIYLFLIIINGLFIGLLSRILLSEVTGNYELFFRELYVILLNIGLSYSTYKYVNNIEWEEKQKNKSE